MKVAVIGYGNLGKAIEKSLSKKYKVIATKRSVKPTENVELTTDNVYAVKNSDYIILTVKPKDAIAVLDEIKDYVNGKTVISFVAFLKLKSIKSKLEKARVVRAMGNIGAEIGKSFTAYYTEDDDEGIADLLSLTGKVYKAESENEIDLMTVFSGSSPAFVAKLINSFVLAGLKCGLNADLAKDIAINIFNSTSELLKREGVESLIRKIATPGGTTVEGLIAMEKHRVEYGIVDSIISAVEKIPKLKE